MLGFSEDEVAYFIAFIGILSCIAQVNKKSRRFCCLFMEETVFRLSFWHAYKSILGQKKL